MKFTFLNKCLISGYANASFLATMDVGTISPVPDPIIFNYARFNPGGNYDTTTGIYTVPLDGTYAIVTNIRAQPNADFFINIVVDGVHTASSRNGDGSGSGYLSTVVSIPLYLTTGQQVWVKPNSLDAIYGSTDAGVFMYSWFAAYLISAD